MGQVTLPTTLDPAPELPSVIAGGWIGRATGGREGGRGFGGFALGQDEEAGKSSGCGCAQSKGWRPSEGDTVVRSDSSCWASGFVFIKITDGAADVVITFFYLYILFSLEEYMPHFSSEQFAPK